jgi:hypothetical protein
MATKKTTPKKHRLIENEVARIGAKAALAATFDNRFRYHRPSGDQPHRYAMVRKSIHALAHLIADVAPMSPELEQALNKLDEACFYANAAIARHTPKRPGGLQSLFPEPEFDMVLMKVMKEKAKPNDRTRKNRRA